jgi:hypothetical protein
LLIAYGRKPGDNNPDAFQGIHTPYTLIIIDEANGVHPSIWDAVDTLATNKEARVLAIGNPDDPTSRFFEICQKDSGWHVIHLDGLQSPNFTTERTTIHPTVRKSLLSKQWVRERAERWGKDSPLYQSKVRGLFPKQSDFSIITTSDFKAALHTTPPRQCTQLPQTPSNTRYTFGADIARYGADYTTIYRTLSLADTTQIELEFITSINGNDTTQNTNLIKSLLTAHPNSEVNVDATGVGAGVLDNLRALSLAAFPFTAAASATDPQRFQNARAEAFWTLRERFKARTIFIPPDTPTEDLEHQLTTLRWFVNNRGRIQIESKEDYAKRTGNPSPNEADAAAMSVWQSSPLTDEDLFRLLAQHTAPLHPPPSASASTTELTATESTGDILKDIFKVQF